MKKQGNRIIKNNKGKIKLEMNNHNNNNNALNSKSISAMQNLFKNENNNNCQFNTSYISHNNESNVIANILETNDVKNELFKNDSIKDSINNNKYSPKEPLTINNDYCKIGDFSFINISKNVIPFLYQPQQKKEYSSHAFNNFKFLDIVNSYRMIITIIIDDDSLNSSINLSKIFESIILSLNSLNEIKITNNDFLVCLFFQHFSYEETFMELFPGLNFNNCNNWNTKSYNFYCSYGNVLSVNDTPINTLLFYKETSTFVEVYRFFYCHVLNDIITLLNADAKEIGKTFLLVNWTNGKLYDNSSNKYHKSRILSNIFRICNNRNMILIPDINYYPNDNTDIFGYINQYTLNNDKIERNLYWDMISAYPIDHRFFFINMNYKLYQILKEYYQNCCININANEYYHDYNLSIYLVSNIKNLIVKKIQQAKIQYSDLPSNLIDYFYDYILRRGSEYANFFVLLSYFFSCKNMTGLKFLQKIFLFFKLLFCIVQFFWLGLSFLISYAVFNDTFGSKHSKMDYFCSLGYVVIIIMLLVISLLYIKNKPKIKHNRINRNIKRYEDSHIIIIILYIIHYLYFVFFIVCTIIAIIHIAQGKKIEITDSDYYIFDTTLFLLILVINLLLFIIPPFFKVSNIISKGFIYYMLLKVPNSVCFFHLPYLFTCIRNIDSKKSKKESIYLVLYILLNGLLTVCCLVFDTKRQRRMDFLFIIGIIFTVINGAKLIILIIGACCQNRFNKNILTGDIPQYIINNDEYDLNKIKNTNKISSKTIHIYSFDKNESIINNYNNSNSNVNKIGNNINKSYDKNNVSNLNSNSKNDNIKNLNKINGKTSDDFRIDKKHDFNKFDTYLKNYQKNENFDFDENNRNKRAYSHKSKLKNIDINKINKEEVRNQLNFTLNEKINKYLQKENEEERRDIFNKFDISKNEISNIKVSDIKYPLDSAIDSSNIENDNNNNIYYTTEQEGNFDIDDNITNIMSKNNNNIVNYDGIKKKYFK